MTVPPSRIQEARDRAAAAKRKLTAAAVGLFGATVVAVGLTHPGTAPAVAAQPDPGTIVGTDSLSSGLDFGSSDLGRATGESSGGTSATHAS